MHGPGKIIYGNGQVVEGIWENDHNVSLEAVKQGGYDMDPVPVRQYSNTSNPMQMGNVDLDRPNSPDVNGINNNNFDGFNNNNLSSGVVGSGIRPENKDILTSEVRQPQFVMDPQQQGVDHLQNNIIGGNVVNKNNFDAGTTGAVVGGGIGAIGVGVAAGLGANEAMGAGEE